MKCRFLFMILVSVINGPVLLAQSCEPTSKTNAVRILGVHNSGELTDQVYPQVAGNNSFYQTLDNGWVFALLRAENGWSIRLYEGEPIGDAVDLTSLTPPFGGTPNPRDIAGWHFRNADNSGLNTGDVNAPQNLRAFIISPSLIGTGGYRPPGAGASPYPEPNPDDGIGWLKVLDYGLAGNSLQADQRARMSYLKFDACVSWPREQGEQLALADAASLDFTPVDHEIYGACGLDLQAIALQAAYMPRQLGGDIDGDGAADDVAQISRKQDGKRGLALCRAGTWMHVIGLNGEVIDTDLHPDYIDQVEAWHWLAPGDAMPLSVGSLELPTADGDILILERIEKEAIALYWKSGSLHSKRLFHFVEP